MMNAPELPGADAASLPFVSVEARRATLALLHAVGAFESGPKGDWNFVNHRLCEMLDVPASSLLGREWIKMIHPDDVQRAVAEYKQARDSGRSWHQELRFRRYDGVEIPVLIESNPLPQEPGTKGVSYLGIVTDVTNQVRSRAVAEEARNSVQTMMDIASEGIWIHRNGTIIAANQAAATLVGYESWQDLIGRNVLDFVTEENRARFAAVAVSEVDATSVGRFVRRDGTEFIASVRGRFTTYAGAPARIGAMLALDSPHIAEFAAERLAAQIDAFENHLTLPFNRLALRNGVAVYEVANQAYADFVGRPLSELIGLPLAEVVPRELNAEVWTSYEAKLTSGTRPATFECTYRRPDGTLRQGRVYTVDYLDPVSGDVLSLSFVVPL